MITIHDLANHRLKREARTGDDFKEAGLHILGGCKRCEATLASYNAYPSTTGYWLCKDCIGEDEGFETPEHFASFEKGQGLDGSIKQSIEARGMEGARNELERYQEVLEALCEMSNGEDRVLFVKAFKRIQGLLILVSRGQCPVCEVTNCICRI